MTFKNASDFPGLNEELGVGWDLGCLMLDTEKPYGELVLTDDDEHVSTDPRKRYVKGLQKEWHVTVRYGLLERVKKSHVDRVLDGVSIPKELVLGDVEMFPSTDPAEPYDCVVARVKDDNLDWLNKQLSVLPNVNTFVEYKPHITIGYFRPGWFVENRHQFHFNGNKVKVLGLNYGNALLAP
jgi:hypothetical protein